MMRRKNLFSTNCPLCGANSHKILFPSTLTKKDYDPKIVQANLKNTLDNHKKHTRIVRCSHCNLVYTNPMENFSTLLEGYKDVVDKEYLETEKYRKILLNDHLQHIEKHKKGKRILDVGCFAGYFLELAKEKKWDVYGIEPSVWAKNLAKKRSIKIIAEDIQTAKLPKNTFDVITMWDVIEHIPNPKQVLQKCHTALKVDGIIALGTPDIDSLISKILKENNPYLVRMHLVFYSPKTLKKLLRETGFEIIEVYLYGRTFPIAYILDRINLNDVFYNNFKKFINSSKTISNYPVKVNIGDSFAIIARKVN